MAGTIPTAPQYIKDFEQLGFGMFVHYGLYSALGRGEWAFTHGNGDMEEYSRLAEGFDCGDISEVVKVAKSAGCNTYASQRGTTRAFRFMIPAAFRISVP